MDSDLVIERMRVETPETMSESDNQADKVSLIF